MTLRCLLVVSFCSLVATAPNLMYKTDFISTGAQTPERNDEAVIPEKRVVTQNNSIRINCTYSNYVNNLPAKLLEKDFKYIYWNKTTDDQDIRVVNSTQIMVNTVYETEQVFTELVLSPPSALKLKNRKKTVQWKPWKPNNEEVNMAALAGVYKCVFYQVGYDEMVKELEVKMDPIVTAMESVSVNGEEPASLVCNVFAQPRPKTYVWTRKDSDSVVKSNVNNYTVDSATPEDRGMYTCTVQVNNITASGDIYLRVKDKYAALWPCIGIILELIVIVIIIFFTEQQARRKKREEKEEETNAKEK